MSQNILNTLGATTFGQTLGGNTLFSINPRVPAVDALEHASILQNCVNKLVSEAALANDPTLHLALSAKYLGEMAQAILDDVTQAIERSL